MELGRIDPSSLVFVDEMGTHTSLAPIYAYAPIGERAFFEIPTAGFSGHDPHRMMHMCGLDEGPV